MLRFKYVSKKALESHCNLMRPIVLSAVFWIIGISAALWWWFDCPPLAVVARQLRQCWKRYFPLLRQKQIGKPTVKHVALPSVADKNLRSPTEETIGVGQRQQKLLKDCARGKNLPLIDRAEVEQNLIAGLHRQRRFRQSDARLDPSDALPILDDASVRERVRAIHSKRLAQQHAKPAPLKMVVLRPKARGTKSEAMPVQVKPIVEERAFVPSESVLLQMPSLQIDETIPSIASIEPEAVKALSSQEAPIAVDNNVEAAADFSAIEQLWFTPSSTQPKEVSGIECEFLDIPWDELANTGGPQKQDLTVESVDTFSQVVLPHVRETFEPSAITTESVILEKSTMAMVGQSAVPSMLLAALAEAAPETLPLPFSAPRKHVVYSDFRLPGLELLLQPDNNLETLSEEALTVRGRLIEEKLAEFKVNVTVTDAYAGPVITRYEIEPAVGVRGNQIVNLSKDLARSLGLVSMRVVETIPGKTCMGLELPNPKRQMIRLSEILSSHKFQSSPSRLTLALGHDIIGQPVVMDLAKAPHLLVAGTTGSGKSVGVNAMILSMLYKATPEEVRLIMIDPKMLELSVYNDIPHLLSPVVTDMKLAAHALTWCVNEMERRYRLMSALGVRNLAGFNQKVHESSAQGMKIADPFSLTPDDPEPLHPLPFIVVVVDEFADLMMVAGKKVEELIARLAQKARAAGIHLILATQRPSVDVITGLIKANIPTRIAFQVSSKVDSRTILDQMGAEALLGQGDMLFLPPGTGYPQRVHGAFVADEEVHVVAEYLKQFGEPDYVDDLLHSPEPEEAAAGNSRTNTEDDPLYDEAVAIVLKTRKASISSVQRQLRIGYNRAARLIEQMEEAGLVSPMENNGNRTVLAPERDF